MSRPDTATPMDADAQPKVVLSVASSHNGRVNGKHWKGDKGAVKRTTMPKGQRTPYERRMALEKERKAVKAVEQEMKDEAQEAKDRRATIIRERRAKQEEKARLEAMAEKMSVKKMQRMKKRQGRSKKIRG